MSNWDIEQDVKARQEAAARVVKKKSILDSILNDENSICPRPAPFTHRGAYDYSECEETVKDVVAAFSGNEGNYSGLRFLHMQVATLHASIQYAMATRDEKLRRDELTKALSFLEYLGHELFLNLKDHKAFFQLHFAQASGRKIQMEWAHCHVNRAEVISTGVGEVNSDGSVTWQVYPAAELSAAEGDAVETVSALQEKQNATS